MAYVVGKDEKKKQDGMNMLGAPGAFANIKSQLQGQQLQQPIQSMKDAPVKKQDEEKKKRFAHGGVVQHFQEGGFAEEEEDDEVNIAGQSRTGGGNVTGRGIGATAPQQRSGSFTGIQDYVTANQPKIQQLSEDISSGIASEAEDIRSRSGEAQEKYLGDEGLYTGGQDFVKSQIESAGSGDQSAEDAGRFQQYRTGAIQGPNLQENIYGAKQLEGRAERLGSAGGRFAELQRMVGKESSGYTPGQRRFDQLLLAGDPKSRIKSIRESREATEGLSRGVGDVAANIGAQRTALMGQAQKGLSEAQQTEQTAMKARQDRFAGLDVGSSITDEDLAVMGVTREQVGNLYGADPSEFIRTGGVSSERLARINALNKLSGREASTLETYDPSALLAGIETAKGRYETVPEAAGGDYHKSVWGQDRSGGQNESLAAFQKAYAEGTVPDMGSPYAKIMDSSTGRTITPQQYWEGYKAARKKAEEPFKHGQGLTRGLTAGPVPTNDLVLN